MPLPHERNVLQIVSGCLVFSDHQMMSAEEGMSGVNLTSFEAFLCSGRMRDLLYHITNLLYVTLWYSFRTYSHLENRCVYSNLSPLPPTPSISRKLRWPQSAISVPMKCNSSEKYTFVHNTAVWKCVWGCFYAAEAERWWLCVNKWCGTVSRHSMLGSWKPVVEMINIHTVHKRTPTVFSTDSFVLIVCLGVSSWLEGSG